MSAFSCASLSALTALLLQLGDGHARRRALARLGRWRVPDRRAPGAFLPRQRHDVGRRQPGLDRLDEGPARRGNLQHARVVEGVLARVEVRIRPHRFELGRTDAVGVGGLVEVHRALDRRHAAGPLVGLAIAGPRDVVDLLEALAALCPALDDLDSVEIGCGRVLHCPDDEPSAPCPCRQRASAAGPRPSARRPRRIASPSRRHSRMSLP